MVEPSCEIVVYGATGFTGRQAAAYLAANAPSGARLGVAGRSKDKLDALASGLGRPVQVIVADSSDPESVRRMVAATRVVLTTAGPFARYGDPVVDAAVALKRHYCDITGESPWVARVIARHHAQAAADGTRIVPFSGFDSVPADLGTWMMVQAMRERWGVSPVRVRAGSKGKGGFNGGTLASALNMASGEDAAAFRKMRLLDVPGSDVKVVPWRRSVSWDEDLKAWMAPFFMAPVNTRVVRRTAGLLASWGEGYGPEFSYDEGMDFPSRGAAWTVTAVMGLADAALRSPFGRRLVERIAPAPGEGPSEASMDGGFFRYKLAAVAPDGRTLRGTFGDQGDPGNRATVKMLGETALALALDGERLPGGPARGGVLTPATALGDVLLGRLRAAGMRLEVEG